MEPVRSLHRLGRHSADRNRPGRGGRGGATAGAGGLRLRRGAWFGIAAHPPDRRRAAGSDGHARGAVVHDLAPQRAAIRRAAGYEQARDLRHLGRGGSAPLVARLFRTAAAAVARRPAPSALRSAVCRAGPRRLARQREPARLPAAHAAVLERRAGAALTCRAAPAGGEPRQYAARAGDASGCAGCGGDGAGGDSVRGAAGIPLRRGGERARARVAGVACVNAIVIQPCPRAWASPACMIWPACTCSPAFSPASVSSAARPCAASAWTLGWVAWVCVSVVVRASVPG